MALAATTLNGAITASQTTVKLTAFTNPASGGITADTWLLVGGEFMKVGSVNGTTLGVVRGINGTNAAAFGTLCPVIYGLTSDFTMQNAPAYASYGADGAITVPVVDTVVWLTKATAGAYTLAAPAIDQQNTVRFVSTTAAAHTITYTAGFYGNTTSSDVATFPATINGVFTIRAQNGTWAPVSTADDGVLIG